MGNTDFDSLPWEQILELSQTGLFEEVFKKIPLSVLQFAVKDENKDVLINSALKKLQKDDPNAAREQALELANLMQEFARKVLEG